VSTTPGSGDAATVTPSSAAEHMGIKPGMVVMEMGWDEDVDDDLRSAIEDVTGEELLDEDSDEVVDIVLLWFRDEDGDLADTLVDAIAPLADDGFIWLLTPKRGRPGYVEPSDIGESAATAGLSQTSLAKVGSGWQAARLVGRKAHAKSEKK
jgi:hypothetical protein